MEDNPHLLVAQARQAVFGELADRHAVQHDLTLAGPVDARQDAQQG
jgi:hypothetical protein